MNVTWTLSFCLIMIHYECDEHFQKEVESNDIIHWNYRNLEFFPKLLKFFGKHVTDLYLKGNCIRTVVSKIILPRIISVNFLNKFPRTSKRSIKILEYLLLNY